MKRLGGGKSYGVDVSGQKHAPICSPPFQFATEGGGDKTNSAGGVQSPPAASQKHAPISSPCPQVATEGGSRDETNSAGGLQSPPAASPPFEDSTKTDLDLHLRRGEHAKDNDMVSYCACPPHISHFQLPFT